MAHIIINFMPYHSCQKRRPTLDMNFSECSQCYLSHHISEVFIAPQSHDWVHLVLYSNNHNNPFSRTKQEIMCQVELWHLRPMFSRFVTSKWFRECLHKTRELNSNHKLPCTNDTATYLDFITSIGLIRYWPKIGSLHKKAIYSWG